VEIAGLLDRTEKTIRNEIKRGLVKNLTTELIEIWVYSADVAQQKYEYYLKAKGPKLKIDNDYELKEYVEKSIKEDKKSPEVIAKNIKKMNFKTTMCARTIRNNIYAGDIYDIKHKDIIYNKECKDKNKGKGSLWIGYLLAVLLRYIESVWNCSYFYDETIRYSLVYSSYICVEMAVTLLILCIPQVREAIEYLKYVATHAYEEDLDTF